MKNILLRVLVLPLLLGMQTVAKADYPERPIRIIVPFAPGGATDILARMLGQKLTQAWGRQVVVDNRTGANGVIASELTAKANPDGYTLLFVAIGHAINPLLHKTLPYDAERNFTNVSLTAVIPLVLAVHPSVKAASVKELIALAKSRAEPLPFGSGGIGSSQHLAAALMGYMAGIKLNHVPYRGGNEGLIDLVAGHIDFMITTIITVMPHARSGKLRALAVTTAKRTTVAPELPTVAENGLPGYESIAWYGLTAPAGLPPGVLAKLSAEVIRSTRSSDVWDTLLKQGTEPVGSTPREFDAFFKSETAKYAKVIKYADMKLE